MWLVRFVFLGVLCVGSFSQVWADSLTYERDIRPLFRKHCFDCHGATEQLEGNLDLRLVRFLQKGGESGPAIVVGQPDESYLIQRVRNGEMPPNGNKLAPDEIAIIARWVAEGAKTVRPEPESLAPGLGITLEERNFWSFRPIVRPDVPDWNSGAGSERVRTPIDALLLARSTDSDSASPAVRFAADADRRTLILRAYFTLTGLPPSSPELQSWLRDARVDWYEQMLSELLSSSHYGEHWARHWLDVAGYADSEGYSVRDTERAWAWKYRDWVIRSLNEDKPFDRFLTEQLAGDELAGPLKGDLTAEQIQLLTATGFLRMAADGSGSGGDDIAASNQTIADTIKIVGTSLLGLSLQCAQCHDHRYDPIPQSDYYAIRAVLEPALDWRSWKTPAARRVSLYTAADRQKAAEIEAEAQKIAQEKSVQQAEFMRQALEQELLKHEEALRDQLREAYQTADKDRSDEQKKLLAMYPSVNITPGVLYQYLPKAAEELKKFDARISEVRARKPPEEFLRALVEPAGHAPETKLFHRGDHEQPKQTVLPGPLTVAVPEGEREPFPSNDDSLPTTGRRLAFANWLTNPENPLVARVIVNRVWMHHFGTGLVATPSDFGQLGARPTHPELLDWLAAEFVASGWKLKSLHRLIMSSTAWRQQRSRFDEPHPDSNRSALALPTSLMRLEAETIRDRMLVVSGQLDPALFGRPLKVKLDDTGQVIVDGSQKRRSLYISNRRSRPVSMLQTFDAPVMETNCEVRSNSTVATQSLMLLNGGFILEQSAALAQRIITESDSNVATKENTNANQPVGESEASQGGEQRGGQAGETNGLREQYVLRAWELAYCRSPETDELHQAVEFLERQIEFYRGAGVSLPENRTPSHQALINLCQTLLSSNEFLYVP